jgi:hypothetical protein
MPAVMQKAVQRQAHRPTLYFWATEACPNFIALPAYVSSARNILVDLYRDRAKLQNISALHSRSSV